MDRRTFLAQLALIAAARRLPAQAPPAGTARLPHLGLSTHSLEPRERGWMRELGTRHVRYPLYWALWERDRVYRDHQRHLVERTCAEGFRLSLVVHGESDDWGGWPRRYEIYQRFADFLHDRAREMPAVEAWEIWNEGEDVFGSIFGRNRPDRDRWADGLDYARCHHLAHQAIRAASPGALVAAMSMDSGDGPFKRAFLSARPPLDVYNVHVYGWPLEDHVQRGGETVRALLAEHGYADVPVWCTEFGMARTILPPELNRDDEWERHQMEAWRRTIERNDRHRWFDRMYGYALWTNETAHNETHGIFRQADWSPRPVARWLRRYIRETRGPQFAR